MSFPSVSPKQSFPALESEVLAYWKANNTFQKSVDSRPEDNPYRFYDGPPFITGTPHYGSLLSSIVKDVVGRYWTMRGKRVDRVWGWDCHGLPIEEKVQKKLGLKSNREIEERGVKEFIDGCYEYTQSTSAEWDWYIDKIGRWVDMDRAYRTMDQDYMESVMWVFSELWNKGLIYEGKRVSLYSWKLSTPISNFEVAMDDTYQEVNDPAITVKFELEQNDRFPAGTQVLAWTTTPWTIPANMALAVRNDIDYVLVSLSSPKIGEAGRGVQDDTPPLTPPNLGGESEQYIVAKNRAESVFKGKGEYSVIREFKGSELVGLGYVPPFPEYYYDKFRDGSLVSIPLGGGTQGGLVSENETISTDESLSNRGAPNPNHKIYHADFITDTDGTGIGHEAPEFGDVDFQLAKKEGIYISEAMDEAGRYTSQIHDYEGTHYLNLEEPEKGANKINIERMKANNTLFKLEGITHRVPFCPRSGTPLMQKAQSSWFIDIQSQKEKLLAANEQINWFPEHLKHGRFAKGIESAPDWCISRTRFWGAPMPVWQNADGSERVVISSREEIYEMNKPYGQLEKRDVEGKVKYFFTGGEFDGVEFNLHKPYIDSVFLAPKNSEKPKKVLGVHGWTSRGLRSEGEGFWTHLRDTLAGDGIVVDVPDFDKNKETKYSLWKDQLDTLNLDQYDTIVAHSFGCAVSMQYIIENAVKIKRLVLIAPSGLVGNPFLKKIIPEMTANKTEIKKLVDEIIIIHSKDDASESAPYTYGKTLSEEIGANLITVDGMNHDFRKGGKMIISGIVLHGAPLTRIPEVLDVWMDSGSMPYAQMHYPFENKGEMEASFPADFIAEYVGQVRAWFYVMHVLGVLLSSPLLKEGADGKEAGDFPKSGNPQSPLCSDSSFQKEPSPAFTNVITTGVINGNDGRKMSKSYGNYPDPRVTIEKYGADPIRFYMLNSPLLSGGDMDFKEEQILETVKGVMLPIWNTYSFFTTYANIDNWQHDETEVWFTRHGETSANASNRMSDRRDDSELNDIGIAQAHTAGQELKEQGKNFDVIIHTSRKRAIATAQIIASEIGFDGEFVLDERFAEQDAGEFSGKTLTEVAEMVGLPPDAPHNELRRKYKENKKEGIDVFEQRILGGYKDILDQYKGKRVLIVAHAGTSRPILHKYFGATRDDAYFDRRVKNAEPFRLMTTPLVNPLDRWVLSRLQVLIGQVHDAMDSYDVSRACRAIVSYMDELTNWYVRLSRRRFWGSEMTPDKASAYETLYTVLSETAKLLAPYMPFISEDIFRGLTSRESVHLEYITRPNRHLVDSELNRDMEICEHIVSLGLALRSRVGVRVRQPLQSITITQALSEYYQTIIRDELNVKEVRFENPEKLAKKICKPDARKIGPKYGKDVQKVIMEAKNGNFVEKENGIIDVGGFVLETGEYTMEYIPLEGVGDVEGGYGMVISLDTSITESLRLEGYARDIIRLIQDMRKEADYQVMDRVSLHIYGYMHAEILAGYADMIQSETLSSLAPLMLNPDVQKDIEIEPGVTLTVQIER